MHTTRSPFPMARRPKRNGGEARETKLGEAPFDATRVARFLRAPNGALRVALVNVVTGAEFASLPLADRSREELARVMAIVKTMETRLRDAQGMQRGAGGEKIRGAAAYEGHGVPRAPEKVASTVVDEFNAPSKDIDITLADGWYGLVRYGLRVGSPDVGFTRLELIGPMAAWEAARQYIYEERERSKGADKGSATAALARIDANLNSERVREATRIAQTLLPVGAKESDLWGARRVEDVMAVLRANGVPEQAMRQAGIVPPSYAYESPAKAPPVEGTPAYYAARVEAAQKRLAGAQRKEKGLRNDVSEYGRQAAQTQRDVDRAFDAGSRKAARDRATDARDRMTRAAAALREAGLATEKAADALERAEARHREAVAANVAKAETVAEVKTVVRESPVGATDRPTADKIAHAFDEAMRSFTDMRWQGSEVSTDLKFIGGSYRSDLPKEGAYAVGEDRYDEMVSRELKRARAALEPALRPYQNMIASTRIEPEEKGWVSVSITLK